MILVDDVDEPEAEMVNCTVEKGHRQSELDRLYCAGNGSVMYTLACEQTSMSMPQETTVVACSYVLVYFSPETDVPGDCCSYGTILLCVLHPDMSDMHGGNMSSSSKQVPKASMVGN